MGGWPLRGGEWSTNRDARKLRLPENVAKAVDFFLILDRANDLRQPLAAAAMVKILSSKELRANLNAATFLQQHFGFVIDGKARADGQNRALVEDKLAAAAGTPWHPYLVSYAAWLTDKPARTVAQYMGVAELFCQQFEISGHSRSRSWWNSWRPCLVLGPISDHGSASSKGVLAGMSPCLQS